MRCQLTWVISVFLSSAFFFSPSLSLLMWLCVLTQSLSCVPTRCNPMDCSPLGSCVPGISWARIQGWVAMPSSRRSVPNPGTEPMSPTMAGGSFTTEPQEKSLLLCYWSNKILKNYSNYSELPRSHPEAHPSLSALALSYVLHSFSP